MLLLWVSEFFNFQQSWVALLEFSLDTTPPKAQDAPKKASSSGQTKRRLIETQLHEVDDLSMSESEILKSPARSRRDDSYQRVEPLESNAPNKSTTATTNDGETVQTQSAAALPAPQHVQEPVQAAPAHVTQATPFISPVPTPVASVSGAPPLQATPSANTPGQQAQVPATSEEDTVKDDTDDGVVDGDDNTSEAGFLSHINLNSFSHLVDVQAGRSMEILNNQLAARPIRLKDLEDTVTKSLEALNVSCNVRVFIFFVVRAVYL